MLTKRLADDVLRAYGGVNRRLGRLARRPLLYFLYLTERCNLNCSYCWQHVNPAPGDRGQAAGSEMTAEEWCRVIDRLPRWAAVGLSGGEPLLVGGFEEIFTRAAERMPVTVNTNGVLLGERLSELFVSRGLRNLSVSLDGFREVHDTSRSAPGLFDRVVANIAALNSMKRPKGSRRPALTIKTTLVDEGVDRLEEFCDYCRRELEAQTVNISLAKTDHHAQFSHRLYEDFGDLPTAGLPESIPYTSGDRIVAVLGRLMDKYARGPMRITLYPDMRTERQVAAYLAAGGKDVYPRCDMPWALVVVMPGGDVIPCLSVRLGNVRQTDYDVRKVLAGPAARAFREQLGLAQRGGRTPAVCNCCCFLRVR